MVKQLLDRVYSSDIRVIARRMSHAGSFHVKRGLMIMIVVASTIMLSACGNVNTRNFAEGLRVMTGKGGTVEEIDTFPAIIQQASQIAKSYPAARWQKMIEADAVDLFELLPGNRLLIGEVQVTTSLAEPKYGDLVLYDLNSGEKLWIAKREDLEWGSYSLLDAGDGQVLVQGISPRGAVYIAIDVSTGRTVWMDERKNAKYSAYDATKHRIYLVDSIDNKLAIVALDERNGQVIWQRTLDKPVLDGNITLMPNLDHLIVLAGDLYKVNALNGEIIWKKKLPEYFENSKDLNLRITGNGILLWNAKRMASLRLANGGLAWGPVHPGKSKGDSAGEIIKLLSVPETNDRIYLWTSGDNIASFDLRNGVKKWEYHIDKNDGITLQSPIFVSGNKVYFSTYKSLTVLDAGTGRRLETLRFAFLESGLFSVYTPDILLARNDKILLLREGGMVYAISGKNNKLLWKQVLDWNYQMDFNTTQISKKLKNVLTENTYAKKRLEESGRWWSNWVAAVDYQWRGYDRQAQLGQFGSSMVFAQSLLGLSAVTEKQLISNAYEGLSERLNMEFINATRNHIRSVQQGYFIRPYESRNGTLVMLVHLDSGKRFDLVYSPTNTGMRYIDMCLPAYIIAPSGKSLYTIGIGTDANKYVKYVKFKYGMPYPSILRYDLSDFKFGT